MDGFTAFVNGRPNTVPYRVYSKWHFPMTRLRLMCRKSRHYGGHVREAALRQLTGLKTDPAALPYLFIGSSGYVLAVSIVPIACDAGAETALR